MNFNSTTIPPLLGPELWQFRQWSLCEELLISSQFPFERGRPFSQIKILGSNGPLRFSIPVKKHPSGSPLSDILMDHTQKWQNQIWRSLVTCYKKSPYFDFYQKELETLFYRRPEFLVDFTQPVFIWLLKQYFPKKSVSVILAPEFQSGRIEKPYDFSPEMDEKAENNLWKYARVFGQEFESRVSVWDALFCMGPNFGINKTE